MRCSVEAHLAIYPYSRDNQLLEPKNNIPGHILSIEESYKTIKEFLKEKPTAVFKIVLKLTYA